MLKLRNLAFGVTLLFGSALMAWAQTPAGAPAGGPPRLPFVLSSPAFADGSVIPDKFTASSTAPVSPPLAWINAPASTVSYALIMHDLDTAARKSSTDNSHWVAFNIPGTLTSLPENEPTTAQLPDGTLQSTNYTGKTGYVAPGARGTVNHHYIIELYALDTMLSLGADATRAQIVAAMDGHVIGKTSLTGVFHH